MVLAGIECSPKIFDFRANGIPVQERVEKVRYGYPLSGELSPQATERQSKKALLKHFLSLRRERIATGLKPLAMTRRGETDCHAPNAIRDDSPFGLSLRLLLFVPFRTTFFPFPKPI